MPKFELYETGSQKRWSSKSIRSNIVAGYGRRRYKNDYIRSLIYSQASTDETVDHLETLFETGSLKDELLFKSLSEKLSLLGKKSTGSSRVSKNTTKPEIYLKLFY